MALPEMEKVNETDPDGIAQGEPGAKLDAGKIDLHLLKHFRNSIMAMADLATGGADKYSEGGFLHVKDGDKRYQSAAIGHWLRSDYETFDYDMQVSHLTCFAWNAMAALECLLRKDPEAEKRLMSRIATNRHDKKERE